jgi:hypothetical protein
MKKLHLTGSTTQDFQTPGHFTSSKNTSPEQGTICYDVLQRFCIFCNEIHYKAC